MAKRVWNKLKTLWIYLLFTVIMVIVMREACYISGDEVLTYLLANYAGELINFGDISDGYLYSPAESAYLSRMTAQEGHRFDFSIVWENQKKDVHPPFYYALLHSVCSLFPNQYSMWFAGVINIIFGLLTLWCIRRIVNKMTNNAHIVFICSLFFMTAAGIIKAILFIRMYVMAMFFVTLVTYLFIEAVDKDLSIRFFCTIILASVCGALTHYYFIIYLFFICLLFGSYLLISRRYKEAWMLVISMCIAGTFSVLIFPAMLQHMFLGGYQGKRSIDNLISVTLADYGVRLKGFIGFIDNDLLGSPLVFFVAISLFLAALVIILRMRNRIGRGYIYHISHDKIVMQWMLLILPSIAYIFLLSKIAVVVTDRYLYPIYAVVIAWILCILYKVSVFFIKKKICQYVMLYIVLIFGVINSWRLSPWNQDDYKSLLKSLEPYATCKCVCIYDYKWGIDATFHDICMFEAVAFINEIDWLADSEYLLDGKMVVYISNNNDQQVILDRLLEFCPLLSSYEIIGETSAYTIYYLHGRDG